MPGSCDGLASALPVGVSGETRAGKVDITYCFLIKGKAVRILMVIMVEIK